MAQETGREPRRGRHDHRASAVGVGADGVLGGRPFEPAKRSAIHARHRELGREHQVGRRLAAPLRLRRPGGRGAQRQPGGGTDRRLDARQAARPRPRRRRVPRPALPEPLLQPQAGADPLRRDQLRRGPDRRRRHDLPARRRQLLRDDDLERRRRGRGVVLLVAGRLGHAGAPDRRDPGTRGGQPRRPEGAGDHGRRHRPGLLERGVPLPRRQARPDRGRPVPDHADRVRRRGRATRSTSPRRTASTSGTR